MTAYLPYLVFVGAAVRLTGGLSYIREMVRGRAKPNRVTWLMWSVSPLIAAAAALSRGVGLAALPVLVTGLVPLMVLTSSFVNKDAYWKLGWFDYACGAFSILALVLWALTSEPIVAIVFAILSDATAAVPTLVKCWRHPETEAIGTYLAGLVNALTSFAAVVRMDFPSLAFPSYLVLVNICLILPLRRRHSAPLRNLETTS